MESIPGMAQGGLRISGWLMTVAERTAMIKIGKKSVFAKVCRHSSRSIYFVSGQRAR